MLWIWIPLRARYTTICDIICLCNVAGWWFSPVSSINKTDSHDITEILLKVELSTIKYQIKNRNTNSTTQTCTSSHITYHQAEHKFDNSHFSRIQSKTGTAFHWALWWTSLCVVPYVMSKLYLCIYTSYITSKAC